MYKMIPYRRAHLSPRMPSLFNDPMMREFFNDSSNLPTMNVDVHEEENEYVLEADLPGIDKKDINLEVKDGVLTISADVNNEKKEEKKNYVYSERRFATEEDGKNSNNYGFYSNAEVDELLNGAAKTTDQEWREKAYQRAAEILYLEDPVGCYLNSRNETVILSAQVEDFNMTPVGIYDWPSIKVRAN